MLNPDRVKFVPCVARGLMIMEVGRPDRKARRAKGKFDPIDAYAVGAGRGHPKSHDGRVEAIRVLRVTRRSALKVPPDDHLAASRTG